MALTIGLPSPAQLSLRSCAHADSTASCHLTFQDSAEAALAQETFPIPLSSWAGDPDTLCFLLIAPELAWPVYPWPLSQKLIERAAFELLTGSRQMGSSWYTSIQEASRMPIKMFKPTRRPPSLALLSGLKILVENLLCTWPSKAYLWKAACLEF